MAMASGPSSSSCTPTVNAVQCKKARVLLVSRYYVTEPHIVVLPIITTAFVNSLSPHKTSPQPADGCGKAGGKVFARAEMD